MTTLEKKLKKESELKYLKDKLADAEKLIAAMSDERRLNREAHTKEIVSLKDELNMSKESFRLVNENFEREKNRVDALIHSVAGLSNIRVDVKNYSERSYTPAPLDIPKEFYGNTKR